MRQSWVHLEMIHSKMKRHEEKAVSVPHGFPQRRQMISYR